MREWKISIVFNLSLLMFQSSYKVIYFHPLKNLFKEILQYVKMSV